MNKPTMSNQSIKNPINNLTIQNELIKNTTMNNPTIQNQLMKNPTMNNPTIQNQLLKI